jgi:hypothetical protein
MKLIIGEQLPVQPHLIFMAEPEVKGVELNGLEEAALLSRHLGAYALNVLQTAAPEFMYGEKTFGTDYGGAGQLFKSEAPLAAEALTQQSRLLKMIASGEITDGPFTFLAGDRETGKVLQAAAELREDVIERASTRPPLRFPDPSLRFLGLKKQLDYDPLPISDFGVRDKFYEYSNSDPQNENIIRTKDYGKGGLPGMY